MAIKRVSAAPTADEYLPTDVESAPRRTSRPASVDVYEDEDEDEVSESSSFVQQGWAAASKEMKKSSPQQTTKKHTEFRFTESAHLVKFLAPEPFVFMQHWVDRAPGRRSFICVRKSCPLCDRGNIPTTKYGFRIVDLTDPEDLIAQIYVATSTAAAAIKEQHEGRHGPIDSGYWELSKTGEGKQSRTVVRAVKERDVAEDWDLDPKSVASEIAKIDDPGIKILRTSTAEELREAAEYC